MKLYWPEAFGEDCGFVGYNRAVKQLFKAARDCFTNNADEADARLYCNIPYHHNPKEIKLDGKPLVVYTMFESTQMPIAWVDFLNRHADAIMVPTRFCREVFRQSGVYKPIRISTLGVDPDEFKYIEPIQHEGFNFLWQGHYYDPEGRKGAKFAEQAFKELLNEGKIAEDTKLILKYRPHNNFPIRISRLEAEHGIVHISDTVPREEMNHILATTDCCINPSRGEGFGYIPLEQMACGLPVILTDWSYPYAKSGYCIPVDFTLEESPTIWCYQHFAITGLGLEWNFGKGIKYWKLPKLMQRIPNGGQSFGPDGFTNEPKRLWKSIYNWIAAFHKKSGLYHNLMNHFRWEVKFESTGYDATINIESLKKAMINVYENRVYYKQMGKQISEFALREYSMARVRSEFENAIDDLEEELL